MLKIKVKRRSDQRAASHDTRHVFSYQPVLIAWGGQDADALSSIPLRGYLFRETAGCLLGTPPRCFKAQRGNMLTTDTFEKALDLLELGYTFPSITDETGITTEDAEAVHIAWFNGTSEQLFRELQLAGVLEAAAAKLRSGQGWQEGATADVLNEILHVFPGHVKKALALALLAGKF
jgi:hypothetical protein